MKLSKLLASVILASTVIGTASPVLADYNNGYHRHHHKHHQKRCYWVSGYHKHGRWYPAHKVCR